MYWFFGHACTVEVAHGTMVGRFGRSAVAEAFTVMSISGIVSSAEALRCFHSQTFVQHKVFLFPAAVPRHGSHGGFLRAGLFVRALSHLMGSGSWYYLVST